MSHLKKINRIESDDEYIDDEYIDGILKLETKVNVLELHKQPLFLSLYKDQVKGYESELHDKVYY